VREKQQEREAPTGFGEDDDDEDLYASAHEDEECQQANDEQNDSDDSDAVSDDTRYPIDYDDGQECTSAFHRADCPDARTNTWSTDGNASVKSDDSDSESDSDSDSDDCNCDCGFDEHGNGGECSDSGC